MGNALLPHPLPCSWLVFCLVDPLPAHIFFLSESSFSWASTASLPPVKKKKKMELFVWENTDPLTSRALGGCGSTGRGAWLGGVVLKLRSLSTLTFYRGIFGVSLTRGTLMKARGS